MSKLLIRTIFAVQHSALLRIGVTYEPGESGGRGLVVSLYHTVSGVLQPPQRFRFWNPAEVTKWFQGWSSANVQEWQRAYHLSGLQGKDFERPGGNVSDVEIVAPYRAVPYRSQRDNQRFPSGTCNVTCCAMPLLFHGLPTIENAYSQPEDNLEYYMARRGLSRHTHGDLETMMRAHGLDARFETAVDLAEIRAELSKGTIVIVSGAFTKSGHITCVIGTRGRDFVVHDPWGDFNTGYRDHNGAARIYSEATLQNVLINKRQGKSPIWAHFVRGRIAG